MEFEAVIGLEVHVQLKTNSKMFTGAPYYYGAAANTLTDPVVLALPGVLPVLNFEAIRKSIKVGMMLGCEIPDITKWDRKNYFYPDSPKNYQLSQFDQPLCLGGKVEIEMPSENTNEQGAHRDVILTRIHLEEDVGKLTHCANDSLVDYNRAGTPLIEIVTEPDMHNPDEVFAFLTSLRNTLLFGKVSECDMEKGQMRCDANISVRPVGQKELGVKVEIKNMNSISGVKAGVDYEIKRQINAIKRGEKIVQETRRWDADLCITQSMRSKEQAHDYRYFPDPDLLPVKIPQELKDEIKKEIPELPFDKQRRYIKDNALPYNLASVIGCDLALSEYFDEALKFSKNAKALANLIVNDLLREISVAKDNGDESISISNCKLTAQNLAGLVKLTDDGVISKQMAKEIFPEIFANGESVEALVERKGLKQNTDTNEIESFCKEAILADEASVEQYKAGNEKAINALVGPVMKKSKGKANPAMVLEILKKLIK